MIYKKMELSANSMYKNTFMCKVYYSLLCKW